MQSRNFKSKAISNFSYKILQGFNKPTPVNLFWALWSRTWPNDRVQCWPPAGLTEGIAGQAQTESPARTRGSWHPGVGLSQARGAWTHRQVCAWHPWVSDSGFHPQRTTLKIWKDRKPRTTSRWPVFCSRQKDDKTASQPSASLVVSFSISPGIFLFTGRFMGLAQGVICLEPAKPYQRMGLPKKDTSKKCFLVFCFCFFSWWWWQAWARSSFVRILWFLVPIAESLGCLGIWGGKKPVRWGGQQGSLNFLGRTRVPPWVVEEYCRPFSCD